MDEKDKKSLVDTLNEVVKANEVAVKEDVLKKLIDIAQKLGSESGVGELVPRIKQGRQSLVHVSQASIRMLTEDHDHDEADFQRTLNGNWEKIKQLVREDVTLLSHLKALMDDDIAEYEVILAHEAQKKAGYQYHDHDDKAKDGDVAFLECGLGSDENATTVSSVSNAEGKKEEIGSLKKISLEDINKPASEKQNLVKETYKALMLMLKKPTTILKDATGPSSYSSSSSSSSSSLVALRSDEVMVSDDKDSETEQIKKHSETEQVKKHSETEEEQVKKDEQDRT